MATGGGGVGVAAGGRGVGVATGGRGVGMATGGKDVGGMATGRRGVGVAIGGRGVGVATGGRRVGVDIDGRVGVVLRRRGGVAKQIEIEGRLVRFYRCSFFLLQLVNGVNYQSHSCYQIEFPRKKRKSYTHTQYKHTTPPPTHSTQHTHKPPSHTQHKHTTHNSSSSRRPPPTPTHTRTPSQTHMTMKGIVSLAGKDSDTLSGRPRNNQKHNSKPSHFPYRLWAL